MARAAPLPHATVPIGRHGVEVHLIKVFCVGQLAVRSELPERENEPEVLHVALVVNIPKVPIVEVHARRVASFARAGLRAHETQPSPSTPAPLYDEDELD